MVVEYWLLAAHGAVSALRFLTKATQRVNAQSDKIYEGVAGAAPFFLGLASRIPFFNTDI